MIYFVYANENQLPTARKSLDGTKIISEVVLDNPLQTLTYNEAVSLMNTEEWTTEPQVLPPPTDSEVMAELIALLVTQGVIV